MSMSILQFLFPPKNAKCLSKVIKARMIQKDSKSHKSENAGKQGAKRHSDWVSVVVQYSKYLCNLRTCNFDESPKADVSSIKDYFYAS